MGRDKCNAQKVLPASEMGGRARRAIEVVAVESERALNCPPTTIFHKKLRSASTAAVTAALAYANASLKRLSALHCYVT